MPAPPRPDQLIDIVYESCCLRGNPLGDPHVRSFPVYLPPQYAADPERRFPVAWYLVGYTGWGEMKVRKARAWGETLPDELDRLMTSADPEARIEPMIVAFPDCFTRFGGSQYRNSPVTGRYEDYLANELVGEVDRRLRTVAQASHRAVLGKSSGGYGALLMGMWHPDVFSMVCSTAGDTYFEYSCAPEIAKTFQVLRQHGGVQGFVDQFFGKRSHDGRDIAAMMTIAYAQAYSPNTDVAIIQADLPFDQRTGELIDAVWQRWRACDPVNMVAKHADALRSLSLLYLDAGTRDEWYLDAGQRIFASRLRDHGIPHTLEEFDGGHMNIDYRIADSLRRIGRTLNAES